MFNKMIVAMVLLFALNCKSSQDQDKMVNEDIVLIAKGNLYGAGEEGIVKRDSVILNENDWQELLIKMNRINKVSNGFSETKIDFLKYSVIAIFDSVKSSGGHSLELDFNSNVENIEVIINRKSPDGMAATVMTQPYYIVKIPKTDLPIVFK
jgi:hypothetical protein